MGVAKTEISQSWLVNAGILYDLGYFHKVVADGFEYKLKDNLSSIFYRVLTRK